MAKKSAKSKGYRKTAPKKTYLSKKEITITSVIAAVVVIALVLFIGFFDDGSLKVVKGKVQTTGENSLVANAGTGNQPHYFQLGNLAEIDGYTMTATPFGADENALQYTYTPDSESPIDTILVRAYALDADTHAKGAEENYTEDPSMNCDGLHTTEDDGHAVSYLTFSVNPSENEDPAAVLAEAEEASEDLTAAEQALLEAQQEAAEPILVQALHGYVNVGKERMVYILIRNDVETVDEYVDDSILEEALNQTLAALSYTAE